MTPNRLDKLRKIRQNDATWLCTARRAPFWIFPKKHPHYRPFITLVMDQDTQYVFKSDVTEKLPTPEAFLENLFKIMQGALLNLRQNNRPARILIDNADLSRAIAPQLAELEIRCEHRAALPPVNAVLLEMEKHITKREPAPGLLSIPGVTVPLAAEFYTAAANYYRQAPWRWMENWLPVEVRYPADGQPQYVLILGHGGETFGLSLYKSLDDLDVMFSRTSAEQPTSRPITWLSLVLEEATIMSFADLDAIEQYGWPVAGEKAYPLVIKITSDNDSGKLPTASELTWLAAALCVIPDFVTQHLRAGRGMPRHAQATYALPAVHGNQQITLRFPAQAAPAAQKSGVIHSPAAEQSVDLQELEAYIQDWYWDESSHEFARQMGAFLFQFFDYLEASGLSHQTLRKHESNCWCIGWLESSYGYHDTFTPDIFLGSPSFLLEFKRKVSDSSYAVNSYQATWRKLEKYVRSLTET